MSQKDRDKDVFDDVVKSTIIYVYSTPTNTESKGKLKIGDTGTRESLEGKSEEDLKKFAQHRIDQQTKTANLKYVTERCYVAAKERFDDNGNGTGEFESFRDYDFHDFIKVAAEHHIPTPSSPPFYHYTEGSGNEWFVITVDQVDQLMEQFKAGKKYGNIGSIRDINLYPHQEKVVESTKPFFKNGTIENPAHVLWNLKPRAGKTISTYALAKEFQDFKRILILTHRPDVLSQWRGDSIAMNMEDLGWIFAAKADKDEFSERNKADKLIWFASIQDIRGSLMNSGERTIEEEGRFLEVEETDEIETVQDFLKNEELFATEWDLVVIDEAHEGTLTRTFKDMFSELKFKNLLLLSGTPYNITEANRREIEGFDYFDLEDDKIFNWTYVDEQKAKQKWIEDRKQWDEDNSATVEENPYERNPYENSIELKTFAYNINDVLEEEAKKIEDSGEIEPSNVTSSLSLRTLFATGRRTVLDTKGAVVLDEKGEKVKEDYFIYEEVIRDDFLMKLLGDKKYSTIDGHLFPYSRENRNLFKHALWMLPGVAAVNAMEKLLGEATGFEGYAIVNATGEGNIKARKEGCKRPTALKRVQQAVKGEKSITLSQQMLTTGVTVPEWSAVLMLNNTTDAKAYQQTIFRATTPYTDKNGTIKQEACVFDFNLDRAIRVIVDAARLNKPNKTKKPANLEDREREALAEHVKFAPFLAMEKGRFVEVNSNELQEMINEEWATEIVESGFTSSRLWDTDALLDIDISKAKLMNAIRSVTNPGSKNPAKKIDVGGMGENERNRLKSLKEKIDTFERGEGVALTPAEKKEYKDLSKAKDSDEKNRKEVMKILENIALRMPMLIFAAAPGEKLAPKEFVKSIDEESWKEFMPFNLAKTMPPEAKNLEERLKEFDNNSIQDYKLYWDDVAGLFNEPVFVQASEKLRQLSEIADGKDPIERILRIFALFNHFRNPDKETVLTPFKVANLQYLTTVGGLQFIDFSKSHGEEVYIFVQDKETKVIESFKLKIALAKIDNDTHTFSPIWQTAESFNATLPEAFVSGANDSGMKPEIVSNKEGQESVWLNPELTVYDPNSKTAFYPLIAAANLYYVEKLRKEGNLEELKVGSYCHGVMDSKERKELWSKTVTNNIFLNCRVRYSKLIAQRVLLTEKAKVSGKVAKNAEINATVIDAVGLKSILSEASEKSKKVLTPIYESFYKRATKGSEDYRKSLDERISTLTSLKKSREEVLSIVAMTLALDSGEFLESGVTRKQFLSLTADRVMVQLQKFDEALKILKEVIKKNNYLGIMPQENQEEFSKKMAEYVGEDTPVENVEEVAALKAIDTLVKTFEILKKDSLPKFDLVVGNPPYQTTTGGKNHQVYSDFYMISRSLGKTSSLIFPIGWQTSTGRASGSTLHSRIREDKTIVSVDNFYEDKDSPVILFPSAGTGGVNIIFSDDTKDRTGVIFKKYGEVISEDHDLTVVNYWNEKTDKIFKKITDWMEENSVEGMDKSVSPWGTHLPSSKIFGDEKYSDYVSKDFKEGYLRCYGSTTSKRSYGFFFVDPKTSGLKLQANKQFSYDKYKVIFGVAAGANSIHRKAIILKKNEIYTAAFIGVHFSKKIHADNFLSYLKSYFYRGLVYEASPNKINTYANIHRFVPDLSTVENPRTKKVGWDSDWTDEDLKKLFEGVLTEEEWEYMIEIARNSDNKGESLLSSGELKFD